MNTATTQPPNDCPSVTADCSLPCVAGADSGTPGVQPGGGGAIPTATLFHRRDWWVADLPLNLGQGMVRRWHYSRGSSNTAVYCHGLFPREYFWAGEAVGVALWLPPTKTAAQSFTDKWQGVLALSRLAIDDRVPANGESFLIRHSMRLIDRVRWPVLVSYADEWRGHTGAIYKATGWTECGRTKPERTYQIKGRMVSRKAGPHTRTHAEMLALGAECVGKFRRIRFVHRCDLVGRTPTLEDTKDVGTMPDLVQ